MSTRFLTRFGSVVVMGSLCAATPARAQDTSAGLAFASPRVEIGANLGGVFAYRYGAFTPGVRVGVAVTPRFAIESGFARDRSSYGDRSTWTYFAQVKQTIRAGTQKAPSLFATYGGAGMIDYWHTNAGTFTAPDGTAYSYPARSSWDVSIPFIASAGIGMQHVVAKRAALRAEVQMLVALADRAFGGTRAGFGARVNAGVSVPIGGYRH